MSVVLTGDRLFNTGECSCTSGKRRKKKWFTLLIGEVTSNTKIFLSLSLTFTSVQTMLFTQANEQTTRINLSNQKHTSHRLNCTVLITDQLQFLTIKSCHHNPSRILVIKYTCPELTIHKQSPLRMSFATTLSVTPQPHLTDT